MSQVDSVRQVLSLVLTFFLALVTFGLSGCGGGGGGGSSAPVAFELPSEPVLPPTSPSPTPSPSPTGSPTPGPTSSPSPSPTGSPTPGPTSSPSPSPTPTPTTTPGLTPPANPLPSLEQPLLRALPERAWAGDRYLVFANSAPLTDRVYQERSEVYLRDLMFGELQAVTTRGDGPSWGPSISECGRFVVFLSEATDLDRTVTTEHGHTNAYLWERLAKRFHCLTPTADGPTHEVTISGDGSTIALSTSARLLPGDTDQRRDIYLHDRLSGELTWITAQETEDSVSPTLNSDGSLAAYVSKLYGSWQVYGWSRIESRSAVLSRSAQNVAGNGDSFSPSLSDLGLVFSSRATNLLPNTGSEPENLFGISGSQMALLVENATSPVAGRSSLDLAYLQDGRFKLLRPEVSLNPQDLGEAEAVALSRRRPLWQDLDVLHACDPDRGQPRRMNSPYQPSAEVSGFPVQELGLADYGRIVYHDLNGNGRSDLIGLANDEAGLRGFIIALANSDGSFSPHYHSVGGTIRGFDAGDFDGDGHLDLVCTVNTGSSSTPAYVLRVLKGDGAGGFTVLSNRSTTRELPAPLVGNFADEGGLDVLLYSWTHSSAGAEPQIFIGDGSGSFQPGPLLPFPTNPGPPAVLDINNDGFDDIAALDDLTGEVVWMINDGHGEPDGAVRRLQLTEPEGLRFRGLQVVELNDDGIDDLMIDLTPHNHGNPPSTQTLLSLNGELSLGPIIPINEGRGLDGMRLNFRVDVTNSGTLELITRHSIVGLFSNVLSSWSSLGWPALGFLDLNQDGWIDILHQRDSTVTWEFNNGDGTFGPTSVSDHQFGSYADQAADFNGDLLMDLMDETTLQLGTDLRSFVSSAHGLVLGHQFRLEDFNGDGLPDLMWLSGENLHVALNLGDGDFESLDPILVQNAWSISRNLADLDQDGHVDGLLMTRDSTLNGSYQVWLGQGDGTFELTQTISTQVSTNYVKLADFNGDGALDIWNESRTVLALEPGVFGTVMSDFQTYPHFGAYLAKFADLTGTGAEEGIVFLSTYSEAYEGLPAPEPAPLFQPVPSVYSFLTGSAVEMFPFDAFPRIGRNRQVRSVIFEDANEDGHLDLLILTSDGGLVRAYGDGTGRFVEEPAVTTHSSSSRLHRFDYDFNGTFDTLVTGARVYFLDR